MRIEFEVPEEILHELLDGVSIPPMARIRYDLPARPPLPDLSSAIRAGLRQVHIPSSLPRGGRIAVGVGSRGIDRLAEMVTTLVDELRAMGMEPFILPAMGSHGGATADGQREVLEHLGVTSERVGAPIISDMDTVVIGHTPNGAPVFMSKTALEADAIAFVARIKPHTAYHGTYESGIAKMMAIGLGKQAGAASTHARGFGEMAQMVPSMAEVVLAHAPIWFAVAVLENAHDQIFDLRVLPADQMMSEEPALLDAAKAAMPRIPFDSLDVLVIDEIGKNISGDGADPNVTGRFPTIFATGKPDVTMQVVLDLSNASGGNANGMGTADFTTVRLAQKADLGRTYPNALTSTVPGPVKLPMILPSDRLALAAALLTCHAVDRPPRVLRIHNTLSVGEYWVSEALLSEVKADPLQEIVEGLEPLEFDERGDLRRGTRSHLSAASS